MKAISLLQPLPWIDQSGLIEGVINTFQLSVQKLKLPKIINTSSEGIIKIISFFPTLWLLEQNVETVSVVDTLLQIYEVLTFPLSYENK